MKSPDMQAVVTGMAQWLTYYPFRGQSAFKAGLVTYNNLFRKFGLLEFLVPLAQQLTDCAPIRRLSDEYFENAARAYLEKRNSKTKPSSLLDRLMGSAAI
jgi:hypothetical protein